MTTPKKLSPCPLCGVGPRSGLDLVVWYLESLLAEEGAPRITVQFSREDAKDILAELERLRGGR